MKKVLFALIAGIVVSFSMPSCSSEKPKTSTDQYMDQQMDEIADQKAAIKNEYKLRMERKKLQDMWERYSDCDAVPEKKNDEPAVKDTCCPAVVVVVVPQQPCPPVPHRSGGHKKGIKNPCPPCPPAVTPVKPPCTTCGTGKTVYVNGEEYKEYHGEEAPASAPGVAKPGYYFNPLDSMWYKKAN